MDETSEFIAAIKLISTPEGNSDFETGRIPVLKPIKTTSFWISNITEEWEKSEHPAPRKQFVVTLKGRIRFKVSDGSVFIIEPGIILLAEDVEGKGHSWELIEGEKWERLYIPVANSDESLFIPDRD
ncbi:cupin domain-containing protein [Chryseobacterium hispalense]|uniref:hypothetical protein n=1 Tax=Chryseobacterium hispalense TaxID=1453492 RepID=UPI0004933908|nr:hypothetical protein [Chryseobacterium hispalense]